MTEQTGFFEPDSPNAFLAAVTEDTRRTARIALLEAENATLRTELAAAEADLAQAAALVPDADEVVVSREDLRALLAQSPEPVGALDRICAAVGL